jgi:hypothetical protein
MARLVLAGSDVGVSVWNFAACGTLRLGLDLVEFILAMLLFRFSSLVNEG